MTTINLCLHNKTLAFEPGFNILSHSILFLQLVTFVLLVKMSQLNKIIHLVVSDTALLLVYSTNNSLYCYQILMWDRLIYTPQEAYAFSFTSLKIGEERIKRLTGQSK